MSKKLFSKLFVLLLVVGLLFAVAPTGQAQAAEMCTTACYVSPTGNDANTGLEGNPFLTIQKAINTVSDGGTIYLAEGNYVENPITTITPNKSFSLIGANDGSGKALSTIQGTLSLENSLSTDSYLIDYINFKQVSGTDSLVIKQIDNLTVRNSVFAGAGTVTGRAIQMNTGSNGNQNILIDNCRFENLYYIGIQGSVNNLTVKDSEFENLKSGINLQSGGSDLTVTNSTFNVVAQGAANDTYGIRLASSTPVGSGESLNVSGSTFNVDKAGFVAESGTYHAAIIIRAGALGPFTVENNQINGDFVDESSLANLTTIYGANTWPVGYGVLGNKITLAATLAMDPAANAAICGLSGTTTVAVKVGPVDRLQAYDIRVNYNPAEVQILSVVDGDVFGDVFGIPDLGADDGQLSLAITALGAPITDLNGGTLVLITLKHKTTGSTVLTLDPSSTLEQSDGEDVPEYSSYPYTITQATSTFTVGDPVVAIGSTEYCTLGDAVTAAVTGDTLKVLRDFSVSSQTFISKQITLDTNLKTISSTSTWDPMFMVYSTGDLTITGGGVLDTPAATTIYLTNFGSTGQPKLTLEDATISGLRSVSIVGNWNVDGIDPFPALFTINGGSTTNGIDIRSKGAELIVNGGLVTTEDPSVPPIYGSPTPWDEGTKITISGGSVRSLDGVAIYHPQDGDLNITGGQVLGATGIVMKSGNLDVSGPSHIYADGAKAEPVDYWSEPFSTGDAILIFGGAGELGYEYAGDITVNIHNSEEAGQVTSSQGYAIREFSDTTTDTRTSSIKISSGLIQALEVFDNPLKLTVQLRNRALADVPNDTLLLTGGYYSGLYGEFADPAYYVFPPLETYFVEYPELFTSGYRIREMAGQLTGDSFGFVKYDTGIGTLAGITSGWTLSEVTVGDVASAEIRLYGGVDGTTLLQTNTAIQLDRLGTDVIFTSPFDIYGDYSYTLDGFWTNDPESEYGQTIKPTCVEATVTLKSGKVLDARNCDIALAPTYDDIKPIPVISSTDIQGYYLVGEERMFSVSVVNPLYGVNYTDGNYIYFTFQMDGVQVADFKDEILWFWSPTNPTDYSEPAAGAGQWIAFNTRGVNETFYNCGTNVCGEFGWASTGFPLPTDYSMMAYLKFTMLNADATAIPVTVDLVRAQAPAIPVTSFSSVVNVYDKPIVSVSADDYYLAGVPGASKVTIVNPATGYNYDNAVWFDMMIDVIADDGVSAFSCTMNGHTWSGLEAFIDYTGVGATLRLGGADGYFTVNANQTLVVDCTITYANAGTYQVSGNMLHVTDKLSDPKVTRVVSDNYSATALVYDKPTLEISQDPYFIAGEAGEFDVRIQNPSTGVPYGNSVVFYLKWAGLNAGDITYPLDCYVGAQHWLYDETDFVDTVEGLQLRLDGADSYFTVTPDYDHTVTCSITYNKTGEIAFTDEMVHVTDKIAGTERTVSDVVSATSKVFVKPVITSMDLPGSFQQGVMETVTIDITSMSLILDPNSYTLHIDLPEGTLVDYGTGTVTCGPTGCDIPVTLVAGANAIDLDITFNGPFVGPLTVSLLDLGFDPDRTLATLATTNNIVHADVALTTGTVTMQGRLVYDYAKFTLTGTYLGYGPYPSTTSDAAGAFSFANIIADEYTITTVMPRYLNIYCNVDTGDEIPDLCKKITLPGVDNVMETIKLRAGNAVWLGGDNEINLDDAGRVGTDWAKPFGIGEDVDLNINCGDVNFDGIVNIRDLALVGGNMDLTSAGAYGEWLP